MSSNKMGLLTMCRKAGKLKLGMDMVKASCKSGEAFGVFVAVDLSAKSLKEVKFICSNGRVPLYSIDITMDEIYTGLGKRVGVMAMTDSGFCKSCAKDLERIDIDDDFYSGT